VQPRWWGRSARSTESPSPSTCCGPCWACRCPRRRPVGGNIDGQHGVELHLGVVQVGDVIGSEGHHRPAPASRRGEDVAVADHEHRGVGRQRLDGLDARRDLRRRGVDARQELVVAARVVLVLARAPQGQDGHATLDDAREADVVPTHLQGHHVRSRAQCGVLGRIGSATDHPGSVPWPSRWARRAASTASSPGPPLEACSGRNSTSSTAARLAPTDMRRASRS
jgi:hypothetical protein